EVACMPRRVNTLVARASASLPRGSRRSRCTRISAEVPRSASATAAAMASRSFSLNSVRVHLGCLPLYHSPHAPPPPNDPPPAENPPPLLPPPPPPQPPPQPPPPIGGRKIGPEEPQPRRPPAV